MYFYDKIKLMPQEILLQLKNVSVHYGGVKALNGVDIAIDEGEIVALMGPNGAGKSTALKAIFGLAPIGGGSVLWHGKPFIPEPHRMPDYGIIFVPQGRIIFPRLTVLENLELGGFSIKNKTELKRRIEEVVEMFPDLKARIKSKAGILSGGQQQMLALARGLVSDPKILLLDEPSLGLAPKIVKEVFAKIKEINERHKIAIMVVEHNIKSLLNIAHRAYLLDKGKIVFSGAAKDITGEKAVQNFFLNIK